MLEMVLEQKILRLRLTERIWFCAFGTPPKLATVGRQLRVLAER